MTHKVAKLGRPPDTNSAATRGRLIDAARKCFGEFGYEGTTNRMIADQAGITTGAIYHYFASKLDIFSTVEQEVHQYVYRRFALALEDQETMVGKLEMMLETAHELHRDDPTLARFLASYRIDSQRVPELRDGPQARGWPIRDQFVADLVAAGIASGEVGKKSGPLIDGLMKTLTVGLTDAFLQDLEGQRLAIDGIKAVLRDGIAFDAQKPPGLGGAQNLAVPFGPREAKETTRYTPTGICSPQLVLIGPSHQPRRPAGGSFTSVLRDQLASTRCTVRVQGDLMAAHQVLAHIQRAESLPAMLPNGFPATNPGMTQDRFCIRDED